MKQGLLKPAPVRQDRAGNFLWLVRGAYQPVTSFDDVVIDQKLRSQRQLHRLSDSQGGKAKQSNETQNGTCTRLSNHGLLGSYSHPLLSFSLSCPVSDTNMAVAG